MVRDETDFNPFWWVVRFLLLGVAPSGEWISFVLNLDVSGGALEKVRSDG